MKRISISSAEEVVLQISKEIEDYSYPTMNWRDLTEQQIWMELVSCILGSQVSYEHANSALKHLSCSGLLNIQNLIKEPSKFEKKISEELSKPLYDPLRRNGMGRKYRYPNAKAKQICQTAVKIYSNKYSLHRLLQESKSDADARRGIMNNCAGIGPKQASLFLRNLGYSSSLAIIDSQVLKFMRKKGIAVNNPGYIRHQSEYFDLERRFLQYAQEVNVNPGDLDMAIWTVMRMADVGES